MVLELYKPMVRVFGLEVIIRLFHPGRESETLPLGGEPYDHVGFYHHFVLRGR